MITQEVIKFYRIYLLVAEEIRDMNIKAIKLNSNAKIYIYSEMNNENTN